MGRTSYIAMAGFSVANVLSWIVVLSAKRNWGHKDGGLFTFDLGLYSAHIEVGHLIGVGSTVLSYLPGAGGLASAIDDMAGDLSLSEALHRACALNNDMCILWYRIYWGSVCMFVCGVLTVLSLLILLGLTYYYLEVHPTEQGRSCMYLFATIAPVSVAVGMMVYTHMTGKSGTSSMIDGRYLWGMNSVVAMLLILTTAGPGIMLSMASKSKNEKKMNEDSEDDVPNGQGGLNGGNSSNQQYGGAGPQPGNYGPQGGIDYSQHQSVAYQRPQSGANVSNQGYDGYGGAGPQSGNYGTQGGPDYGQQQPGAYQHPQMSATTGISSQGENSSNQGWGAEPQSGNYGDQNFGGGYNAGPYLPPQGQPATW